MSSRTAFVAAVLVTNLPLPTLAHDIYSRLRGGEHELLRRQRLSPCPLPAEDQRGGNVRGRAMDWCAKRKGSIPRPPG
jgi:hypothetical protein